MDSEFVCNLEGYRPQYSFKVLRCGLTTEEAERIFQLTPAPPRVEKLNDHIIHAVAEKACLTYDKLGAKYNITTEEGARLAYQKAVENLTLQKMEDGAIRAARIKLKSKTRQKKKIATAVYEYQADCDGEWGEIYFDFEKGRQKILWLADWDTTKSRIYAKRVIDFVLKQDSEELPKERLIAFEK